MTAAGPASVETPTERPIRVEPSLATVPKVRLCLVQVAVVVAVTGAHVARVVPLDAVVLVGALVALSAVALPARYVAATGVTGWAWLTGFVVNAGGVLTLHAADVVRLAVLMVVAAGAVGLRAGAAPGRRAGSGAAASSR